MRARIFAALVVSLGSHGCQIFVDSDPEKGIGAQCDKDTECQASKCIDFVCALECETQEDCPGGTLCTAATSGALLCQLPLKVAFVVPPEGADFDWTTAHTTGAKAAASPLTYVQTKVFPNADSPGAAASLAQQAVAEGYQVVFGAASDFNGAMQEVANQNPAGEFFTCGGGGGPSNHHGYYGGLYEAWYIAGQVAATKSTTDRLGAIGSYVTPAVVRHINAFILGAQKVKPAIVVEVRWMLDWFDKAPSGSPPQDIDRILAAQLVDSGCDVISYHGYKRSAAFEIKENGGPDVYVIGNNYDLACEQPDTISNCLATVYWNWAPLYASMIDLVHKNELRPDQGFFASLQIDPAASVPNIEAFEPALQQLVSEQRTALAQGEGPAPVFSGPFCSTGQRDGCVAEGETIQGAELGNMCWFVQGAVTLVPGEPPTDEPAQVPAEGDCAG